ncbi:MAG: hypothetical protein NT094_03840 [Candidatus Staskawiczbacteria bacterium]|nr:hypothetical protein [Candidatus Staskawiczbacteria bacterium]
MLSEAALKSFKELYLAEFGEKISDERVQELAMNLLTIFSHVYKPVKKEWSDKLSEKTNKNKNI